MGKLTRCDTLSRFATSWRDSFSICCKLFNWNWFVISFWSSNQFEYRIQHIDCFHWESSVGFSQDGLNFSLYVQQTIVNLSVIDSNKNASRFSFHDQFTEQWSTSSLQSEMPFCSQSRRPSNERICLVTFCFESEEKRQKKKKHCYLVRWLICRETIWWRRW